SCYALNPNPQCLLISKIDKERRLVIRTMDGVFFSLADGLAHQEELLKDPDFAPNFRQLVDCIHITKLARKAAFLSESRQAILGHADGWLERSGRTGCQSPSSWPSIVSVKHCISVWTNHRFQFGCFSALFLCLVHNPLFRSQQRRAARAFLCCIELRKAITL